MAYIFLEEGDLESAIIGQFLTERSQEIPTDILELIEKKKIATIKAKLRGRFDTDAIFDATGNERNFYILDILTKLVLHEFIRRNAARKVPKDYQDDFDGAMKILEAVKAGKEVPDGLPPITNNGEIVTKAIHGNNRNKNFYI